MKLHPRVTKTAVELVKRFEGLRRRAARLPDGAWTIGYGHTKTAREGAEVTPDEAELLLYYDLSEVATKVEAWTFTALNQNQFEALTAFAFNIGTENFRHSTVLKRVNEGLPLQAAASMELWRKTEVDGEGLIADALVRRRAAEKAHFLTPPEGFKPSPTQVLKPVFDFSVIEAAAQSQLASRVAVVDAPLDGEETAASVERPFASTAAAPPVQAADEQAAEPPQAPRAENDPVASPVMPEAPPTPAAPEPASSSRRVNGIAGFNRSFPSAYSTPTFRGFQPPPRFSPPVDPPPAAANEYRLEPIEAATPLEEEAEPAFNLFDRPLAPPPPAAPPVRRVARLLDEDYPEPTFEVVEPEKPALKNGKVGDVLQNRTVVWGAVGCLGVLFFALAITSMMIGKATIAHLAIGLLGILLITPAGVYFLLRRSEATPPAEDVPPEFGETATADTLE